MIDWMHHYDWPRTMSYDARINLIIGGRDYGKTYGLRYIFLKQYIERDRHPRFVEICRTKELIKTIRRGYLEKVIREFPGYEYRAYANEAQVKRKDGEWETCGYFVSLSEALAAKQSTYIDVANIVMDEALIDRKISRYQRYEPNELMCIQNLIDSCTREDTADDGRLVPKLYLLGNAVDCVNPYFDAFRVPIRDLGAYGYRWYMGKRVLMHHVEDNPTMRARKAETLAGILAGIIDNEGQARGSEFAVDDRYVFDKPARAKFQYGIKFEGERYGIWIDWTKGYYFVCSGLPKGDRLVFALTASDNAPNLQMIRRAAPQLQTVAECYMAGTVMFDSARTREKFMRVLNLLGVR